ncbi:MAG: hypothetical protein AVDCRST_MAG73-2661 [uncultured Thermomicrobiales bacterium]|uniref:Cupin 2 conserved barrel domain-containing protein n=1 Tax=uncultured Thermomicrobiales bacterium TaxID=1645740 RepID=A0A6J4UEM4_9BACT|nr:MAG: hypothetical protein AVDCRST_MAG73-2661 [uncultured Thermomicrobiales bacterium]
MELTPTDSAIPTHLAEVGAWFAPGYAPVLDFHGWRVAMLRRGEATDPARFHRVERHRETNEVFILTAGRADLILMDGDAEPGDAHVVPMTQNVAYNVGQAVWHHVVMDEAAHIVLVERTDTSAANSDYAELGAERVREISDRFRR